MITTQEQESILSQWGDMNRRTAREGLEMCVEYLKNSQDDPLLYDSYACINCYQLQDDCVCDSKQILWPLPYAIKLLQSLIAELS